MGRLLVIVCLALYGTVAYADTIAMLPLDGEKRLEIYGQPVAAEIARALKAAGLDVVLVSAQMDVPDRAQLIVDGTIKATKNKQIEVSIRVRDPRDGTVLATLPAPTTKLDDLDKAAAELSARVVPSVRTQLEALGKPVVVEPRRLEPKPVQPPAAPTRTGVTAAVVGPTRPGVAPLGSAIERELPVWRDKQHYAAKLSFEVISYEPQPGPVPSARARVRVVIEGGPAKFDRIVRTDTVVGDPRLSPDQLAARTAREVLAIVQPHLRRAMGR